MWKQWFAISALAVAISGAKTSWGQASTAPVGMPTELPTIEVELQTLPEKGSLFQIGDQIEFRFRMPPDASLAQKIQTNKPLELRYIAEKDAKGSLISKGWGNEKKLQSGEGTEVDERLGFRLIPLKPGTLQVPPLTLFDSTGAALAKTGTLAVDVKSLLPEDEKRKKEEERLKKLLPAESVPFPYLLVIFLSLSGLALLGVVIFFAIKWAKGRKRSPKMMPISIEAEDVWALRQIDEMISQKLHESSEIKLFYFRMSEIFKEYLSRRYSINAIESTTPEIQGELSKLSVLSVDLHAKSQHIFDGLDWVKFTDFKPNSQSALETANEVKEWILQTRKPALPAGGKSAV